MSSHNLWRKQGSLTYKDYIIINLVYIKFSKKIQTYKGCEVFKAFSASKIDKVTLDRFFMVRRFDEPAFRKDFAEMIAKKAGTLRGRKKLLNQEFACINNYILHASLMNENSL